MKKSVDIFKEEAAKLELANTIIELGETATDDQLKEAETLLADAKALRVEGDAAKARETAFAEGRERHTAVKTTPANPAIHSVETKIDVKRVEGIESVKRYAEVKHFTGASLREKEEKAYRFGRFILAALGGVRNPQWVKWCEDHDIELKTMTEGVNTQLGYLVPDEFDSELIVLREMYGVFRRNTRVVPMAGDTRNQPRRTGGLTAYFVGEGTAPTTSNKTVDLIKLIAKKLAVLAVYSSELAEDAVINIGDDLASEIAYAFALKEDQCGFIGDGTSTYGGIVGLTPSINNVTSNVGIIAATGTGYGTNWNSMVLADFENVVGALPQYADTPNAKWFCHRTFYFSVMKRLELAAGGATAAETAAGGNRTPIFLGYPVEFAQVLPATSAINQIPVAFGDLRLASKMGDRRQTTISLADQFNFDLDVIDIRGTERFDINVHDVGSSTVAGPVVALKTAGS